MQANKISDWMEFFCGLVCASESGVERIEGTLFRIFCRIFLCFSLVTAPHEAFVWSSASCKGSRRGGKGCNPTVPVLSNPLTAWSAPPLGLQPFVESLGQQQVPCIFCRTQILMHRTLRIVWRAISVWKEKEDGRVAVNQTSHLPAVGTRAAYRIRRPSEPSVSHDLHGRFWRLLGVRNWRRIRTGTGCDGKLGPGLSRGPARMRVAESAEGKRADVGPL